MSLESSGSSMINRTNPQKILAVRNKLNSVLDELLANRHYHYIMDINKATFEGRNFTHNNLLNVRGQRVYWQEVDRLIEEFDYNREFSASKG